MRQRNVRKRLFIAAVVTATVAGVSAWAIATQPAYAATTGTIVPLSRAGGSSFAGGVATGDPVVDAAEFDQAGGTRLGALAFAGGVLPDATLRGMRMSRSHGPS
jgi:hypothetical protein